MSESATDLLCGRCSGTEHAQKCERGHGRVVCCHRLSVKCLACILEDEAAKAAEAAAALAAAEAEKAAAAAAATEPAATVSDLRQEK